MKIRKVSFAIVGDITDEIIHAVTRKLPLRGNSITWRTRIGLVRVTCPEVRGTKYIIEPITEEGK